MTLEQIREKYGVPVEIGGVVGYDDEYLRGVVLNVKYGIATIVGMRNAVFAKPYPGGEDRPVKVEAEIWDRSLTSLTYYNADGEVIWRPE